MDYEWKNVTLNHFRSLLPDLNADDVGPGLITADVFKEPRCEAEILVGNCFVRFQENFLEVMAARKVERLHQRRL